MSDDDPFDCFGEDDSEDDQNDALKPDETSKEQHLSRHPSNGILAFHAGTEQALLHYVSQKLENVTTVDPADSVLKYTDEFCIQRHWMMHVGNDKGRQVEQFVKACCQYHSKAKEKINIIELGTYCGYSSILIARAMKQQGRDFQLFTVEVVEHHIQIATKMIELAGLSDCIHVLTLDPTKEKLSTLLRRKMESTFTHLLFIDHDKDLYLEDLQQLEKNQFIRQGSHVAADNVIFAKIDAYRDYVSQLAAAGVVQTQLVTSYLEYCEPDHLGDSTKQEMMKDGIELTIYQKDPITSES